MAFAMTNYGFFTTPDDLDRALEFHDRQSQQDLDGHIFPSAECAADSRVDHTHLLIGQAKGVGDLLLVGVCPLTTAHHGDAVFLVQIGQPGLRLEIGVLLVWRMIFVLNNHIRPVEGGFHIAFADLVPDADIGIAPLRVQARCIRLHGLGCIINGG